MVHVPARADRPYLLDVGDVQGCVNQTLVHWMFGVFAFFVQVHRLQGLRRTRTHKKNHWIELSRGRRSEGENALWDTTGTNGRTK